MLNKFLCVVYVSLPIEVGRVGRQEVQFHAALRTFQPWLKYLGMMATCIVEHDVGHAHRGVDFLNLFRHLLGGYSIDRFALDEDELECFVIKCALNVDPLATRCGFYRGLLILREPAMSRTALILGMHCVRKQNFFIWKQ